MAGAAADRGSPALWGLFSSMEYGPVPEGCGPALDRPKIPRTRAATWSHAETLDFLALWGQEGTQAQLKSCHRNAEVYQWISQRMAEKGYQRDEDQCRTKGKDLKKSYKQAKDQDGLARQRCKFYPELDAIFGRPLGSPQSPETSAWCHVVVKEENEDGELEDDFAWPDDPELGEEVQVKEEREPETADEGGSGKRMNRQTEPPIRMERRVQMGTALNRRGPIRPRGPLSTRERLAYLRNRRKRGREEKFDELFREIRTHYREREKLFRDLWEEERAQREEDRRLWAAEMDWIRQLWAKREREMKGDESGAETQQPEAVTDGESSKEAETEALGSTGSHDALVLKAWLDSHGRTFGHFIDGKWLKPGGRESHASRNPATGEHLAATTQGTSEDLDAAVEAAAKAFESWSRLPGHVRARHLYNVARTVQKHHRLLSILESLDSGKLIREARDGDLPLVIRHFYHHAGWAQLTEVEMGGWKPLGVVAAIVLGSLPLLTLTWKVCPALAMGNTVVINPAGPTRLSALLLAEACTQAGLPAGVLNVVTGDGALGEALAIHPGIKQVAFAGDAETARALRRATAGTGTKLTLQLGGKSPFVVFESADLDSAVEGVVDAVWINQGQVHSAGAQLLIQESVVGDFTHRLKRRMGQLRVGDALDKAVDLGALADEAQRGLLEGYVEEARAEGAEIFQAWAAFPSGNPYYPPTLITGVETSSRCVREEISGPVLVVLTFRTPKEAVTLANNTPYGLAASVWTETLPLALEVAHSLQVGTVWVNGHNMFDAASAFGGYKESGYGRDGGKEGLYDYVRPVWETPPRPSVGEMNYKSFGVSYGANVPPIPGKDGIPLSVMSALGKNVPSVDRTYKLYYGGAQKRPDAMCSRPVLDHAGKIMAYVADGNAKDIRNAVEAAHKAAPGWARRAAHARAQIVYYLAENLELRRVEVASRLAALTGASSEDALHEVDLSVQRLFHWAAYSDKYGGAVQETPLYGAALLCREPVGVVGVVCPDDSPLLSFVSLLAPAIARGNAVVMVASECSPLPALDFYQVLDTSDVPGGVVNIITGGREHLSRVLAEHQDVQAVWYFGTQEGSKFIEWASAGNLKQTWVNYGAERHWADPTQGSGEEFLHHATQCKSIWLPMGETFAN